MRNFYIFIDPPILSGDLILVVLNGFKRINKLRNAATQRPKLELQLTRCNDIFSPLDGNTCGGTFRISRLFTTWNFLPLISVVLPPCKLIGSVYPSTPQFTFRPVFKMGCDGGTIPKRHELVKGPKKVEKVR